MNNSREHLENENKSLSRSVTSSLLNTMKVSCCSFTTILKWMMFTVLSLNCDYTYGLVVVLEDSPQYFCNENTPVVRVSKDFPTSMNERKIKSKLVYSLLDLSGFNNP